MPDIKHYYDGLLLAAIHYNENADRPQATTAAGEPRFMILFPKWKKGDYSTKILKSHPLYAKSTNSLALLFQDVV
ncbi:hypothetical protein J4Q44_G00373560 [Coregonus suidteri]|uniref:Uncharacterized protein n=1 Tax=Coregonus suidteri TaxID=861788 RepID=A0AAN8KPU6_9TELE